MDINYSELDPRVVPLVRYFNDHGLKTMMSCQGHGIHNMSIFWIQFDRSIDEEDIVKFMMSHRVSYPIRKEYQSKYGQIGWNFVSNGRFARRLTINLVGQPYYSWNYFAANADAADNDLENWIQIDEKEQQETIERL